MTFGNKLRNLLDERDISQKQLASELSIAPSTLGNYIQDTREPDFATLKQFANYFGVSLDYLLSFGNTKSPNAENEVELLRIFRCLTKEQQVLYLEQGKVFIKLNSKKGTTSPISHSHNAG